MTIPELNAIERDCKTQPGGFPRVKLEELQEIINLARTEKFVERLTTLSAWLMGYTGAYLAHWGTASSRKSRSKS